MASDFEDILVNGISFSRGGTKPKEDDGKVKTKAKKKKYIPELTVRVLPNKRQNIANREPTDTNRI